MFYSPLYLIDWLNFLFEIISNKVIWKFSNWLLWLNKIYCNAKKEAEVNVPTTTCFSEYKLWSGIERLKKANISTCRSLALCRKCLQKQFYLHCKQTEVLVKAFYFCKFLNLLYIVFVWEWQWQCFFYAILITW